MYIFPSILTMVTLRYDIGMSSEFQRDMQLRCLCGNINVQLMVINVHLQAALLQTLILRFAFSFEH